MEKAYLDELVKRARYEINEAVTAENDSAELLTLIALCGELVGVVALLACSLDVVDVSLVERTEPRP